VTAEQIGNFRNLIDDYIKRVRALKRRFPQFVLNEDLFEFAKAAGPLPEVIMAGDNPGCKEHKHRQFLSGYGKAGKIARYMWLGVFGAQYLHHVLVLNKSNYSTATTPKLGQIMRAANSKLLSLIKEDHAANGELIHNLARLLKTPVVILGGKNDAIFRSFRETIEVGGMLTHTVSFDNHTIPQAIQTVPHCSRYGCFKYMTGDHLWNARIDSFLTRYGDIENIRTAKGNISEKTLRSKADRSLWCAYFTYVILGVIDEGERSGRNGRT
jgi:hypothetical protein